MSKIDVFQGFSGFFRVLPEIHVPWGLQGILAPRKSEKPLILALFGPQKPLLFDISDISEILDILAESPLFYGQNRS